MLGNFIQGFSLGLRSVGYVKLSSPAFKNQGILPVKYTCFGEGVSPPLNLENFSESVRAFAITFDDGNRYHWVIYYVDRRLSNIPEGAREDDLLRFGINDFGIKGYTPPCPTGRRLYRFTLFALSEIPPFKESPTGEELLEYVKKLKLAESHLLCYVNP